MRDRKGEFGPERRRAERSSDLRGQGERATAPCWPVAAYNASVPLVADLRWEHTMCQYRSMQNFGGSRRCVSTARCRPRG
eukprot:3194754-Rhodomonas_salina.2